MLKEEFTYLGVVLGENAHESIARIIIGWELKGNLNNYSRNPKCQYIKP